MASIKYDFTSCYSAYDFSNLNNKEINTEFETNILNENVEDILRCLLI
jgi:hypothetical protein